LAKVKTDLLVGVVPLHRDLDGALVGVALEIDDVLWIGSFASLMYETKSLMPPS